MKECIKVKKILSRYLDQEVSGKDNDFIKSHLNACQECNKEYLELSRVKQLVLEKERKSLPADYLTSRLKEQIVNQRYAQEKSSWVISMGRLSRRLIPVPVTVIIFTLAFLFLTTSQQAGTYSLDEHLLSGARTTTETALNLILGG